MDEKKLNENREKYSLNILSLLGICSGCIVMGLVFTMINTTIPVIQKALKLPIHHMQWMMMTFGMINCAFLVTSGRLADIFGRKKIFIIGLCSSCLGMVLGGLSRNSFDLILSMSFAGLGNAILLPVSQAMLVSEFPESQKSRAIAIWAAAIAYAMAAGPLVGGMVAESFGWEWVFWSVIPLFAMSLLFVLLFSKESRNALDCPRIDFKGMFLLAIGLSAFVFVTTEFNRLSYWISGVLILIVFFALIALWKNSQTFSSPILLPGLIRKKVFLAAAIGSASLIFYIWATFFLLPLYLENVRELSSIDSGFVMLAITIPVVILSPIVGKRYQPSKAWIFIFIGFLFLLSSSLMQGCFYRGSSLFFILIALLFYGVGFGIICGPTATRAISVVPPHRAGIVSGTFVTFQEIGGTLGLAFVVTTVRLITPFEVGFQRGCLMLTLISLIGCIAAITLRQSQHKESI